MRILIINCFYYPDIGGGAEITIKTLAESLADAGHEVHVACLSNNTMIENIGKVTVHRFKYTNTYWHYKSLNVSALNRLTWLSKDIWNIKSKKIINSLLLKVNPDVISYHNLAGWSSSVWQTESEYKKLLKVQVLHDYYHLCRNSSMFKDEKVCRNRCLVCQAYRLPNKALSKHIHICVGVSDFVTEVYKRNKYFTKSIRATILNARNAKNENLTPNNKIQDGKVIFGYIGLISKNKGVNLLIDAFTRAQPEKGELLLAGREADITIESNCDGKIKYLGYTNPEDYYKLIDILVVPSMWEEPLGMVVPEANRAGVPVLVSNRGGLVEMIVSGENGFIFDVNEVGSLTRTIATLSEKKSDLIAMRSDCIRHSEPFYDTKSWSRRYVSLYHEGIASLDDQSNI